MNNKKNIKRLTNILLYAVFIAVMVLVISLKIDYHMDETLTYGLSNHAGPYYMSPEEGVRYEPSTEPYIDYLSVQPGNMLNLSIPYINQANDSHPPIYYMIIHLVCGLTPRVFSRWQAGAVNIFFALATLFVLRKIIRILTDNDFIYNVLSWAFVFCFAILSEISFFRMYVMVIFITTLTTYLFLWQLKEDRGLLFYFLISLVILIGALTHYGTLIYSALICITYGIYLLIHKKWKDVFIFCGLMAIAGVISIVSYPVIIRHIFGAGRGGESIGNLLDLSDLASRLVSFYHFVDSYIFARMSIVLILAIIVMFVLLKNKKQIIISKKQVMYYLIMFIPSLLFFIVAAKSSPYIEERYISAIYPIVFVMIYCPFMILALKTIKHKNNHYIIAGVVFALTLISLFSNKWQYLYRHEKESFAKLDDYSSYDCVCVYDGENWRINTYIIELTKYNSLTFINRNNIEQYDLEKYITTNNGIVCLAGIFEDEYMNEVMKYLPNYSNYKFISERSFYIYK